MTPPALLLPLALSITILAPNPAAPGLLQVIATDSSLTPLPVMVVFDCALAGHVVRREDDGLAELETSAADVCRVEAWAGAQRNDWRIAPVGQGWTLAAGEGW